MPTKLLLSGLALILGLPAVFSGDIVAMAGGLLMLIGAVLMWLERK